MVKNVNVKSYKRKNGKVVQSHVRQTSPTTGISNKTIKPGQVEQEVDASDSDRVVVAGQHVLKLGATRKKKFRKPHFLGENFEGADLGNLDLCGVTFDKVMLQGADFSGSDLRGARFLNCRTGSKGIYLKDANLRGSVWADGVLKLSHPCDLDLTGVTLENMLVDCCKNKVLGLNKTKIVGPLKMRGAKIVNQNLRDSDFSSVHFGACYFQGADFDGSTIEGISYTFGKDASFTNTTFLKTLEATNFANSNFEGARFDDGVTLSRCNFHRANLSKSTFGDVEMFTCSFTKANFSGANLGGIRVPFEGNDYGATGFHSVTWDGCQGKITVEDFPSVAKGCPVEYDHVPFTDALNHLGVSERRFEFLVLSNVLEVRDNRTGKVVTSGFNPEKHHVVPWSLAACKTTLQNHKL